MKSRFILNGAINLTDKISAYRLISPTTVYNYTYEGEIALKIFIPNDMEICKYKCDNYSTTEDTRRLLDLDYKWLKRVGNKWVEVDL